MFIPPVLRGATASRPAGRWQGGGYRPKKNTCEFSSCSTKDAKGVADLLCPGGPEAGGVQYEMRKIGVEVALPPDVICCRARATVVFFLPHPFALLL